MVRRVADLSSPEASGRGRCAETLRTTPTVKAEFAEGRIGVCHVDRIAKAHANPRVRAEVEAQDAVFAREAETKECRELDREVDEWVRLVDEDGTRGRDQSSHDKRDARIGQDLDGHWEQMGPVRVERELARLAGLDPAPVTDALAAFPAAGRRCSTLDGRPVEATATVARALTGDVRRVVIGPKGTVIDLGRKARLFTGSAALAVKLSSTTCYWPGCHVPVSDCQGDHLVPWSTGGGSTGPRNGGPACGRHNRLRHHGSAAWRDPDGTFRVTRPDGTGIT